MSEGFCPECGFSWSQINELILEFVEDLTTYYPMIGVKYTRRELIEKWEKKLNDNVL